ncbi:MAG: hypothetical protein ABS81_10830 [Pseudonocardia sp. SCN 72-86]|nr:MAG: hypothetical protein ABS81_10830 [Pseudonocardia sp. SCN 72-86]
MLSDREKNTLREVQRQLVVEDPDFVRSFDDIGQQQYSTFSLHRASAMPRVAFAMAIIVAVVLSVLMLLARAPGAAFLFAMVATTIAVTGRRRDASGPPPTGHDGNRQSGAGSP